MFQYVETRFTESFKNLSHILFASRFAIVFLVCSQDIDCPNGNTVIPVFTIGNGRRGAYEVKVKAR